MRYYITDDQGFREVDEATYTEFDNFVKEVAKYATQVKNGEISLSDVPETHYDKVAKRLEPTIEEKAQAYDILMGVSE